MEKERNYLPWIVALRPFAVILDLLKPRPTDSDADYEERGEVYERFKTWVIGLMMPYFYENGFNDALDATEEEEFLKETMKGFACTILRHQLCFRFIKKQPPKPVAYLTDEEYCEEMLPKIVYQSDVTVDVALDVLEKCPEQVIASPNKEEFMSKVTSKVETKKELDRLNAWEKKHRYTPCPPGKQCSVDNALAWAKRSIEKANTRIEAKEKCRDMVFQTIKQVFV